MLPNFPKMIFLLFYLPNFVFLVAPYCAIPRDYLSDTPLLRAMGFLVSQHGQLGAIPPPPFSAFPRLRAFEVEVRYPPLKRGISRILARYPMKTRQMGATPPSAILSRNGIARYGGVSRSGPLSLCSKQGEMLPKNFSPKKISHFSFQAPRSEQAEMLPNFFQEHFQPLQFSNFVFKAGGNAAQFSQNDFSAVLSLCSKQGEMLPKYFSKKISHFSLQISCSEQGEMLPNFSKKHVQPFQFSNFAYSKRGNAAHFFPRRFFNRFIFQILCLKQREMLPNFYQEKFSAISVFKCYVQNRGKCCPNVPSPFIPREIFSRFNLPSAVDIIESRPKAPGGGGPPNGPGDSSSQSTNGHQGPGGHAPSGGGAAGSPGSGGRAPPPPGGQPGGSNPPGNTPPQQTGGAGYPGGTPSRQVSQNLIAVQTHGLHLTVPGSLYRSSCYRPITNHAVYFRQLLESWYDRSTFAIATWRGDAQGYWLTQVLDCARNRHDQWLQSIPSQQASLEPAYILGDRKHIPEAQNAVESVLRTELLDVIPKSIADACMRHGYCTTSVWKSRVQNRGKCCPLFSK